MAKLGFRQVLAGFLPPEDGTGRGQGYFTYTIAPIAGLPSGTEITNIALITFDHFETIATDQIDPHDPSQGTDPRRRAPVTLDAAPPESHVESLPATVPTTFTVSWSGSDDTGGAGVAAYDIFVSENDAPFTIWIRNTAETSADFTGEPGQQYAFYSLAIDGVGHREVKDQVAEVQTTVSADSAWHNASLPLDVNADQLVTPIDALIIINALNQLGSGALSQINLTQHFYYDTNADDLLSPMDVLLIINWLNKQSPAEGELAGANAVESVSRNNYRPTGMPTFAPKQANTFAAPIEDLNNKNRFSDWDAFFDELGASADSF
ncbi:MAG: dockerin type I domain-containing protein [Pirellulaceae bacterium]